LHRFHPPQARERAPTSPSRGRWSVPHAMTLPHVERMLAPSSVKPSEFDMVFAGATAARAAALQAGAVDAAILLPPFNFQALTGALESLDDLARSFDVNRLLLRGVTELSD
jgi:hypothetical protein